MLIIEGLLLKNRHHTRLQDWLLNFANWFMIKYRGLSLWILFLVDTLRKANGINSSSAHRKYTWRRPVVERARTSALLGGYNRRTESIDIIQRQERLNAFLKKNKLA